MTARLRNCRFALFITGVLAAAVCGGCAKTGTVGGRATVDGKPASGATVIFSGGENQSALAVVQTDGTYETPGVPVGPVRVAIMPAMFGRGGDPKLAPKKELPGTEKLPKLGQKSSPSPPVPKRYTNVNTSGLNLTVKGGHNDFDIAMSSP